MLTYSRDILICLCFMVFLVPVSIYGISANYVFVFFPIISYLFFNKRNESCSLYLLLVSFYLLLFLLSISINPLDSSTLLRSFLSFLVFMSAFVFIITGVEDRYILLFKCAIVAIVTFFSLFIIFKYYYLGGSELYYSAKNIVGTQRYGFILIGAFWIVLFFDESVVKYGFLLKNSLLLIIVTNILLTFSRASVVTFVAVLTLYYVHKVFLIVRYPNGKLFKYVVSSLSYALIYLSILYCFVPVPFIFYNERIINIVMSPEAPIATPETPIATPETLIATPETLIATPETLIATPETPIATPETPIATPETPIAIPETLMSNIVDPRTSGGTRIMILRKIADFVLENPFLGSGYLGVWILGSEDFGSAHNQYADVLFRTGFLGFLIYIFILMTIQRDLYYRNRDLFWAFLGILIYGFFHETFKESHGAFVLAFLFGMSVSAQRAPVVEAEMKVVN